MIFERIFSYLLLFPLLYIIGIIAVDENINFIPFERNENTGGTLTLAGEHALQNGILQLSKRNKKDLPIFDAVFSPGSYETENNQHPFDDDINDCGGLYKNFSTLITTPNFGIKNYEPGLNCEYIIFSPYPCPNEFHIQFLNFQLEYSENCTKDYLEIGNEPKVCGQVIGIKNYKTEDGVLVINFRSDGIMEDKGFKLLITRQPCQEDYIIRKLRQNEPDNLYEKRKNKSLNVKGIANHLLPPFEATNIKNHQEKLNEKNLLSLNSDNNNNNKGTNQYTSNFKPFIPGLIPININNEYLPPHKKPVNNDYSNHNNIPFPDYNPLLPPLDNSREYLPPPKYNPKYNPQYNPETSTNNNPGKPTKPTFILGTDNVISDFPTYPKCHTIPSQFYPLRPTEPPFEQIPPQNFPQYPFNYYPTILNSPPLPNYQPQNVPHIVNFPEIPYPNQTPIQPNYSTNNNRGNIPIHNTNGGNIPYPFNATSVFYPQEEITPSDIPIKTSLSNHLQPQILGIIPGGTLAPCCANIFQEKRFYLASPGFPHSSNYLADCVYYIRRISTNICRLRIRFKFFSIGTPIYSSGLYNNIGAFNNIPLETCLDDFIEIDGQRLCGCKTNLEYISQWGLQDKVIRLKLSGRPGNNLGNGFILDMIQEECPYRLQRNANENDLTSPQRRNDNDTIRTEDKEVIESNSTIQTKVYLKNTERIGHEIKRQISLIRPTEGPNSQFFVYNNQNQCIFTPNNFFNLIIESLWITKPQCIVVGQAILRV